MKPYLSNLSLIVQDKKMHSAHVFASKPHQVRQLAGSLRDCGVIVYAQSARPEGCPGVLQHGFKHVQIGGHHG